MLEVEPTGQRGSSPYGHRK